MQFTLFTIFILMVIMVLRGGRCRSLQLLVVFILLSLCMKPAVGLSTGDEDAGIKCIERERQALLMFKQGLIDEYGHLSSWGDEDDKKECCKWRGVSCSNQTGRVTMLNLQFRSYMPLRGTVPHCLNNFTAMTENMSSNAMIRYPLRTDYYNDHALLVWKRTDSEYRNTLGLVKSIDLSSNRLYGEIPEEVTSLVGLISLNLSKNGLTGPIPSKIGRLTLLNSIDLSKNMLMRAIPEGLSQLSLLGVLDLSDNNLTGKIPSSTQLQSFDASSYIGNPELCGLPLPNKCPGEEQAEDPAINEHADSKDGIINIGFYVSIVLGFITGFWGVCGTILLNSPWRYEYFRI